MRPLVVLFILICSFIQFRCEENHYFDGGRRYPITPRINSIIMFSDSAFTFPKDGAKIEAIRIQGDLLTLEVAYGGGCKEHIFKLYGSKYFLKSNPPQTDVFLSHNSNGDMCDAWLRSTLSFDLYPLRKAYINTFHDNGPLYLRIHEPGMQEPLYPLVLYRF